MLKILSGIAIIAFTTFCGWLLSQKFRRRKLFFEQFKEFNEHFLNEIAYYRRPIQQFIADFEYEGEFNELLQLLFSLWGENSLQKRNFMEVIEYSFLKNEEKRMIADYFLMLGRGDSVSQKGYFSAVKDTLAKYCAEAERDDKRYGDLYVKLGILFGLFILIIII